MNMQLEQNTIARTKGQALVIRKGDIYKHACTFGGYVSKSGANATPDFVERGTLLCIRPVDFVQDYGLLSSVHDTIVVVPFGGDPGDEVSLWNAVEVDTEWFIGAVEDTVRSRSIGELEAGSSNIDRMVSMVAANRMLSQGGIVTERELFGHLKRQGIKALTIERSILYVHQGDKSYRLAKLVDEDAVVWLVYAPDER